MAQPRNAQPSEGSLRGSFVAILTPIFAVAAAWIAGEVTKIMPGVDLKEDQIVAFMIAAATAVLGIAYKWLQGWQQHEQRVTEKRVAPVREPPKEPKPPYGEG